MAAYCPPTLVYNDTPSGIDCHSSIPYYDDLYTEPLKRKTPSRKSSAQRLRQAVGVGLRACRSKLGSRPSTPQKCDDSDELSIMCAGLEKSPEHEDDHRRSSGSRYSISSSSFGLLYSSSSPSSPSTSSVSPLLRSRSPSDSSQGPPTPPGAIPHHFAFPLVSLTQAAGETIIAKRPELYERSSMDSIASWDGTPWNSMFGYREESFAVLPSAADDEWQYDGILSLYDEPSNSSVSGDSYDVSEDLLPPFPPAVVSSLARATPETGKKRNVLRRCPRRISLRNDYLERA